MNKKFWSTAFTLTGNIIGAGILGLPFIFAQSGFLIGLVWVLLLGVLLLYVHLCLAEVTLRTKGRHQLSGYAYKYLGKTGGRLMNFTMLFGIYAALLAYLVGEGQSLSVLFGGVSPLLMGVLFWLIMTLFLQGGISRLKRVEFYGVFVILLIVLGMFVYYLPFLDVSRLLVFNSGSFFLPFGIVLFSLMGFTSLPELRQEIKGQEKLLKKAVIVGSLVPLFLYVLFVAVVVGLLGVNVPQVATLSFGPLVVLLGMFTMLTSYFLLSFALRDLFLYDMGLSRISAFVFSSLVPLLLYLLLSFFPYFGFAAILSIGGMVSGSLTGILAVWMNIKSKKSKGSSLIDMPINSFIAWLITLVFVFGLLLVFVN